MIKVAGLWELGWSAPLTEHSLWNFMLRDFEVEEWCMCPVSGLNKSGLVERMAIETYIDENPEYTPVVVDEKGLEPLHDFKHPKQTLYLLGKASRSLLSPNIRSVQIKTPAQSGLLWPHQAISIVLYDRWVKSWP